MKLAVRSEAIRRHALGCWVNLRLNTEDVEKIRKKAEREGIPYQILIIRHSLEGSVLHKYATDQLLDENAVRAVVRQIGKKVT